MIKNLFQWLLMRKVKNEAGQLQAQGVSMTKVCAVMIGLMQFAEFIGQYFGHPISFDPKIYGGIATIGGIALRDAVARSGPNL